MLQNVLRFWFSLFSLWFQLSLNTTFFPTPQPHATPKCFVLHHPKRFSTQNSQYQNWKATESFSLTVIEVGPPVLQSSIRISRFYIPTDSEHRFNKTRMEHWLPIGFRVGTSWWKTCSHNHYAMFSQ